SSTSAINTMDSTSMYNILPSSLVGFIEDSSDVPDVSLPFGMSDIIASSTWPENTMSSNDDVLKSSSSPYYDQSVSPSESTPYLNDMYSDLYIEESSLPYDYHSSRPLQSSYEDQIEESSLPYDYYSSQSQFYNSQETSYCSSDEMYSSQETSYSSAIELYSSSDELYSSQEQPYSASYPTSSIMETLISSSSYVSTQSTRRTDLYNDTTIAYTTTASSTLTSSTTSPTSTTISTTTTTIT
ncbi:topoisomerase I damage affected protein 7, partial [Biomphalaria pfeifferi]